MCVLTCWQHSSQSSSHCWLLDPGRLRLHRRHLNISTLMRQTQFGDIDILYLWNMGKFFVHVYQELHNLSQVSMVYFVGIYRSTHPSPWQFAWFFLWYLHELTLGSFGSNLNSRVLSTEMLNREELDSDMS